MEDGSVQIKQAKHFLNFFCFSTKIFSILISIRDQLSRKPYEQIGSKMVRYFHFLF